MSSEAERPGLDHLAVLDRAGHRRYQRPADVRGRFTRMKPWVQLALVGLWVALPLIHIGGYPAVWVDLPRRHFYLFGATFNAQDFYLAFFVVSGLGFSLIVAAALFGRVWCGWACPQTVFLEGFFRRVERWIEGPAERRRKLAQRSWSGEWLARKSAKHVIYLALSVLLAHVFLAYFTSVEGLGRMFDEGPGAHPETFGWAVALTALAYGNFWWFREQLCIVICPYGRLQSALQDQDTINVVYDCVRGEPRGKAKQKEAAGLGDCVDCRRCIAVCPTGIDIRQGHQLECLGCAGCIDACDEVMDKLGRPRGLIRYDSQRGVDTGQRHFWRPRVYFYGVMGLVGLAVATLAIAANEPFEAEVLRSSGAPFTVVRGAVENQARVHLVNKHGQPATFRFSVGPEEARWVTLAQPEVTLQPFDDHDAPVLVRIPAAEWRRGIVIGIDVSDSLSKTRRVELEVLGPHRVVVPASPEEAPP